MKRGFTLLEVMITLMILSVMSILTAQSVKQAFKSKGKIEEQLDSISQSRNALRILEEDLNSAFHYLDLEKEMAQLAKKIQASASTTATTQPAGAVQTTTTTLPTTSPNNPGAAGGTGDLPTWFKEANRENPETHFIGTEKSLYFVTRNSQRLLKDSPQSDYGEVGYLVESCKRRTVKGSDLGQCLFRKFSPLVDKDVEKGGKKTQLLTDVTSFELKYYSVLKKDWVKDWRSDEKGDASTKGRYPEYVDITLKQEIPVAGTKTKKKIELRILVPIHFPNNPDENSSANKSKNATGTGSGPGATSGANPAGGGGTGGGF